MSDFAPMMAHFRDLNLFMLFVHLEGTLDTRATARGCESLPSCPGSRTIALTPTARMSGPHGGLTTPETHET